MLRRRRLSVVAALFAATTAAIVTAPAASAAPLPRNCTQALFQSDIRCTFTYTGAPQVFTVPQGLRQILVLAVGAKRRGHPRFRVPVDQGRTRPTPTHLCSVDSGLFVYVGGAGSTTPPAARVAWAATTAVAPGTRTVVAAPATCAPSAAMR